MKSGAWNVFQCLCLICISLPRCEEALEINRISANFYRTVYRRWNYHPIELHCPFENPSRQLWCSSESVYKAAFGCLDGSDASLLLPLFPDVENVKFIGLNTTHYVICTFRLTGELIEADALLLSVGGTSLTFNITICKTGVVRNGSCSSWDALGTSFTGEQVNRRHMNHYGVRYAVRARDGDRHQCMGSIDGRTHSFVVQVKADLNECLTAAAESIQLCWEECQNLFPSYRCTNNNYSIPCTDFKTDGWMCLQEERRFYPPSIMELDGIGTCELTANEGHNFCPLGAMDCIDSPFGPKCRSEMELSLIEASSKLGRSDQSSSQAKRAPVDLDLLIRKVSTDKNMTYLVQKSTPLLWQNSKEWIQAFGNITKESVYRTSPSLFESKREVSSENLLQSVETLLSLQAQRQSDIVSYQSVRSHPIDEIPQISVSTVVKSASALLNVFSALTGGQDSSGFDKHAADEFTIQRNGLELRRIRINKNQSDMQNESIEIHSPSNASGQSTALMITIPARRLEPFLKNLNGTDSIHESENISVPSTEASFVNLDSDVYIVHSSDLISLLQLKLASRNERKEDATCRIWDMLNAQENAFGSHICQTRWIGEKYYECRCTPSRSGTFAVGLVYIMSSKDLKNLRNYGTEITVINYVCSVITIIALSLFLLFSRFVGVFRLDQFHIALSLLLGTLVSLFIPHVPEDFEFLCAVTAVLVNYFPLCAFAWKFIFGLNALLMIVAPHADFNDIFNLRVVYIPVTICAYSVPAVIVGFWFGMARQFKSGLGLCIGPDLLGFRWPLLAPITAVVLFNLLVLMTVGFVVLRNYIAIRRSRVNKSTHLLVLAQLMLTLGIPYMLIYVQIISPVFMLLILPIGIALTAVFMFLLVAAIDDENRHLLRIFLATICKSGRHGADTAKSTTISSPDTFLITDGLRNHMTSASSANNSSTNSNNHEYFAHSRNRFALDSDLTAGILRQPMSEGSSSIGEDFKSAVLVPLEVAQLPTQYYYNPQSPHHNAPVIRFESLHDLVIASTPEFNEDRRTIHSAVPEIAYSDGVGAQHFYPKSRKQFMSRTAAPPTLVSSYYVEGKNSGF